jgi:hypothetical protein
MKSERVMKVLYWCSLAGFAACLVVTLWMTSGCTQVARGVAAQYRVGFASTGAGSVTVDAEMVRAKADAGGAVIVWTRNDDVYIERYRATLAEGAERCWVIDWSPDGGGWLRLSSAPCDGDAAMRGPSEVMGPWPVDVVTR